MDKQSIREAVWARLEETGAARFPFPVEGRIPNFAGADEAAARIADLPAWEDAKTIKANPDYAQFPVRRRALAAGKDVYLAVPRLADERCFLHLDPATIDEPAEASSISGANEYGTPVYPEELPAIDGIVVGSVAVTPDGVRIGKGEGYSDLEYALLREFDRVSAETPVITTVHEHQVVDEAIPGDPHDVPIDHVLTPERHLDVSPTGAPPEGIDWSLLDEGDLEEKPVLARLADQRDQA